MVPRQFIASRESPGAAVPITSVRLLARVRSFVRLQVARFRVRFRAALIRAFVNPFLFQIAVVSSLISNKRLV